jgi:hypothetical protein
MIALFVGGDGDSGGIYIYINSIKIELLKREVRWVDDDVSRLNIHL